MSTLTWKHWDTGEVSSGQLLRFWQSPKKRKMKRSLKSWKQQRQVQTKQGKPRLFYTHTLPDQHHLNQAENIRQQNLQKAQDQNNYWLQGWQAYFGDLGWLWESIAEETDAEEAAENTETEDETPDVTTGQEPSASRP